MRQAHPFQQYGTLLLHLNHLRLNRPEGAKNTRRFTHWTEVEEMHLKYLYGQQASSLRLKQAFPDRSYDAIKNKAVKLGLDRRKTLKKR